MRRVLRVIVDDDCVETKSEFECQPVESIALNSEGWNDDGEPRHLQRGGRGVLHKSNETSIFRC